MADFTTIKCIERPLASLAIASLVLVFQAQPLDAKPLPSELAKKERAVRLSPSTGWQLEVLDDRCRLARKFTSSNGPGLAMFEQLAPGNTFDLTIAGPDTARSRRGAWFYAGMRSDLEMKTIDPLEYGLAGFESSLTLSGVRIDDQKQSSQERKETVAAEIDAANAERMDRIVLQRSTTIISYGTGNMKAPLEALNACSKELLSIWKLDAGAHQSYRPAEMPGEGAYFSRLHHNLVNTRGNAGHESILRVRALIGKDGSVTDCFHEYVFSSGGAEPDVCKEIRPMQFSPATNQSGEPIASFYSKSYFLSQFDPWQADAHGER
ncbi:MAG: hypothetical protein ABJX46_04885 [Erythrobacter sp.]